MRAIKNSLKSSVSHAIANDAGTSENVEARTNVKASAASIQAKAHAFAEKMADDEDGTALVERYLEAKVDVAMGPQWFYKLLCATYTDEELAATPIPGTKMETKDPITKVVSKNNNPDEYDAPKADGSVGTVSRFWHWDVADTLPAGKMIQADLRRASALSATDTDAAGDIERNANKRLNNLRGLVARGIAVWHQVQAIKGYENVSFQWDQERKPVYEMDAEGNPKTDKDGNYIQAKVKSKKAGGEMVPQFQMVDRRTESPVIIKNTETNEEGTVLDGRKAMSIVQFLSLDVPLATENGGTYADLMATMRRDTEEDKEPAYPAINKVGELGDVLSRMVAYLQNDDNYDTLKRTLKKQSEGNDHLAANIKEVLELLTGAYNSAERLSAQPNKTSKAA